MTPRVRIAIGVVLAAGGVGMVPAAAAAPAGTTLQYQCSMPLFPEQPMTVRLTWNAPRSVPVGQKTPIVPFTAVATMGDAVTQGLDVISAATVEGSADATGDVAAPEGKASVHVPLTVPRTNVPPSGPITVVATGVTPALTFHQPGKATITVGNEFAVRLIPKTASGGSTLIGQVDASCTLKPGQNTVLTSFEIAAPPGNPAPPPRRPAGPTSAAGVGSGPQKTDAAGPSGSSTAQAPSTVPSSELSPTEDTSTTAADDTAFTTISTAGLAAAATPWLVGGAILVLGVVLGCVWWLRRRHRRAGQGHPDSL